VLVDGHERLPGRRRCRHRDAPERIDGCSARTRANIPCWRIRRVRAS